MGAIGIDIYELFVLLFCIETRFNFAMTVSPENCKVCSFITETFRAGMKKTENQHFGGGNTEWEEKKLGRFATSETRLVEVMEYICKVKQLEESTKFSGIQNLEYKCQSMVEEYEEHIENWYHHKQHSDPDMFTWLCVHRLSVCCPVGRYGPMCTACPGAGTANTVCSSRGVCDGDGTRSGTGKCKCEQGYAGSICSVCDANYYDAGTSNNSPNCKACHPSCSGGCTSGTAFACESCRRGWIKSEEGECKDIDECLTGNPCTANHMVCVNTNGSYRCDCKAGYMKDASDECIVDVNAPLLDIWIRPDTLLRFVAIPSLCILLTLVVWRRSVYLLFFAVLCLILAVLIELRIDHNSIPDVAKSFFKHS
ncbi:hypothetical protein AB6A40_000622 [Gnathostoma spinigerum]|uniref:EGF-like domain-containing protein n=1 Tax=Gnathostoma spinigerum TaxID=75299 RepID=A0ABD6E2F9_9BILA